MLHRLLCTLSTLFFFSHFISAQSIQYGDNFTATLEVEGEIDEYTFDAIAGDRILLRMKGEKDGVDGCFSLLAPDGTLVGADCDDGRMVALNNLELLQTGTYTLMASDHNDNDTGSYGISLQVLNRIDQAMKLSCETEYEVVLENLAEVDAYVFEVEAGAAIMAQMRGVVGNMEPVIEIYNEQGELVKRATAKAGLSRIGVIRLEDAGNYLLLASDEHGNDVGDYGISIQYLNSPDCAQQVGCGADFTATLETLAEIDAYVFDVEAGDVLVAHMRGNSNSIEPLMELYGPDGSLIGINNRRGKLGVFPATQLTQSGRYVLLAMDEAGNDKGDYSMSFQFTNAKEQCAVSMTCANNGDTRRISKDAEMDAYTFSGEAGQVVSIKVVELDVALEPRIEIYAPDGGLIHVDSDNSEVHGEFIELSMSGIYTVLVMDYEGNDEGRYEINISDNAIQDLTPPEVICKEITIVLDENGVASIGPEDVDNGSHDACGLITWELDFNTFTCEDKGEQTVTLIVKDDAGNIATCETKVTVEDPTFACGWDYCESVANSTEYEWIENVTLGTINNTSGSDGGYGDYSNLVVDLQANSSHVIELSPGFSNPSNPLNECWGVWIDFNDDGDFEDEGEYLIRKSSISTALGTITIPADAAIGTTRMRVAMNYEAYPSECGGYNFGETEDYTINILAPAFCGELPDLWSNSDVGNPELEGNACYSDQYESFTVSAASKDIYNKADQFHFTYTEFCGDGEIIARLVGMQSAASNALAGIMIRNNLDDNASNVALLATKENGIYFQVRKKKNKDTKSAGINSTSPVWMKLVRTGSNVTGFTSNDGANWIPNYSATIKDAEECLYFGMAVTSNDVEVYNTATFDRVQIQPAGADDSFNESSPDLADGETISGFNSNTTDLKIDADRTVAFESKPDYSPSTTLDIDLENEQLAVDVVVYPNPAVDYARLEFLEANEGEVEIAIFDTMGQLIWETQTSNENSIQIDLRDARFLSGQYWVKIKTDKGLITKPLLIVK